MSNTKNKKILITGADGFLASRIVKYFLNYFEECYSVTGVNHKEMDFTDYYKVRECVSGLRPDIIIHCGAISDTGVCEKKPDYSYKINVIGTENIARGCEEYGMRLIFCSSDQVYFGRDGLEPHRESEELAPANVYGRQKLDAEKRCMEICRDTAVLRLSWMYDWNKEKENEHGNLLTNIMEAVKLKKAMSYPIHDYRSITDVWEVVKNMEKVFSIPPGVYNFGSENEHNTYEVVRYVLKQLKSGDEILLPNKEAFADKPRNLKMNMEKTNVQGILFSETNAGIVTSMKCRYK